MMRSYNDSQISAAFKYYRRKTVVVKYGGAAMQTSALKHCIINDIALLRAAGANVIVVHGGGPELTALQERLGLETKFIGGQRYTNAETMEAALMALCGKVNKELVCLLESESARTVGISGVDGSMLRCKKQASPDLGFVGEITKVRKDLLHVFMLDDIIPVVATVGIGDDGRMYNINADTAAGRIAAAVCADYFLTLTDVPGVLSNVSDPTSVIREIRTSEIENLISTARITGGMIPKVRGIADAIGRGLKSATIVNGRIPHALMLALMSRGALERGERFDEEDGAGGTTIVGEKRNEGPNENE